MMPKKRLLIYSPYIRNIVDGNSSVGGIAVQLFFWAKTFIENGWDVYALTNNTKSDVKEGINFIEYNNWGRFELLHEWLFTIWFILSCRPNLIMVRGATRSLYHLSLLSRIFHIEVVFFGASDVNFIPGEGMVPGKRFNTKLYQMGLARIQKIVVQNTYQYYSLKKNYSKVAIILPSIWHKVNDVSNEASDVIWVANIQELKRPEWILNAAKKMPHITFTIIGGPYAGKEDLYKKVEHQSSLLDNVSFLGAQPFIKVCGLVARSKILTCTSTFEGFPNTFLQAWSVGIPVVSTVDPSNVISNNNLGVKVDNCDDFVEALRIMLTDEQYYSEKCSAVVGYFGCNHSANTTFNKLTDYLYADF